MTNQPHTRMGDVIIQHRTSAPPLFAVSIAMADGDLVGVAEHVVNGLEAARTLAFLWALPGACVFLRIDDDWLELPMPEQRV